MFLKKFFDWYLNASLHVSLSTTALVQMTFYFSKLPFDWVTTCFVFFGTLFSYNTIKYVPVLVQKKYLKKSLWAILLLSVFSAFFCGYLFFKLRFLAQCTAVFFAILSLFYLFPFGKSGTNLRNHAGLKIYIVSLCWAGVTLLIPLFNADYEFTYDLFFKFGQRFILTLILILIFEINDLKYDDLRLHTVPQIIGVHKTKRFIYALLIPFYFLEFFKHAVYQNQWIVNFILVLVLIGFTYFASSKRSRYYTLFWVESIPILWYVLILIF